MEFELWWLLPIIAVVFGLGWIAALPVKIALQHIGARASAMLGERGIDLLLRFGGVVS